MSSFEDASRLLEENASARVTVIFTDLDGILRAKRISAQKALAALKSGLRMTSALLGWDLEEVYYRHPVEFGGFLKGCNDFALTLLPETIRHVPEPLGSGLLIMAQADGPEQAVTPRNILQTQCEKAAGLGISLKVGVELEFWILGDNPTAIVGKPFDAVSTPRQNAVSCSLDDITATHALLASIERACQSLDLPVETTHIEGTAQYEVTLEPMAPLEAADSVALLKWIIRAEVELQGFYASFMAKPWAEAEGSGLHLHTSLQSQNNDAQINYDGHHFPADLWSFLGGTVGLLNETFVLLAPTVNSYKRFAGAHAWLGSGPSWGIDSRRSAIRVIGPGGSARLEHRTPGSDANPYLAMAAILGAGLWGIEDKAEPPEALPGDYDWQIAPPAARFPSCLSKATRLFSSDPRVAAIFGKPFVDHFTISRDHEVSQFQSAVTDWEIKRYLHRI